MTKISREDLVKFGEYLFSEERVSRINANHEDGDPVSADDRLKQVYHADIENFLSTRLGRGHISFGEAIEALKEGKCVARAGWNGKGMFLYHVPAMSYPALTPAARKEFGDMVPYGAYIAMKTAQNNVVPWLASQTDLLSDDWEVLDLNID